MSLPGWRTRASSRLHSVGVRCTGTAVPPSRGASDAFVDQVDRHVAERNQRRRGGVAGDRSTGDGPDARQQLIHAEGLCDVVVGSGVEGGDLVRASPTSGEHDDGHLAPAAHSVDHFHAGSCPRSCAPRGDRLAYSNGILALALVAGLLVVAYRADVDQLLHLYILGVFTSFSLSQAGMIRHWNRELQRVIAPSVRRRINGARLGEQLRGKPERPGPSHRAHHKVHGRRLPRRHRGPARPFFGTFFAV